MAHNGYYTESSNVDNVNELLNEAELYRDQSLEYSLNSAASADLSSDYKDQAEAAAMDSQAQAAAAAVSAAAALASEGNAQSFSDNAEASAIQAAEAQGVTLGYRDEAEAARDAAQAAQAGAEAAEDGAVAALSSALLKANNLSDLTNVGTAQTNLGISEFVKTLLDDATANDFLTTLGVSLTSLYKGAFYTYGGTANAITLTADYPVAKPTSYVNGARYRFKATATNTGALTINIDGLGAKTGLTVTGVACPAGYIRTDTYTECWYDSVANAIYIDRQTEYGSNANGEFWRYADGKLDCQVSGLTTDAISNATGSIFRSNTLNWTLPAAYIDTPKGGEPRFASVGPWSGGAGTAVASISMRAYASSSIAAATFNWSATGRWY